MAEAIDQGYYISKSGTEIQAVFNGVKFGDLHMIKYAVQRDVANVHVMGTVDAVSVAKVILSTEAVVLNSEEWMK